MEVWQIMFLSKWVICMFHVNLPGCSQRQQKNPDDGRQSRIFRVNPPLVRSPFLQKSLTIVLEKKLFITNLDISQPTKSKNTRKDFYIKTHIKPPKKNIAPKIHAFPHKKRKRSSTLTGPTWSKAPLATFRSSACF